MNTRILPRTIINPSHGYSVTFLISGSENNGAFTYVEVVLPPKEGTPMHYHLDFTEQFEAVSGTLGLILDGKTIHLNPDDPAALVPVKAVHRFFNPGEEPIRFRCLIQPARRFEKLLRIIYGLGDDGLMKANGMPKSILHLALIYEIGESYFPGMPLWLQQGIFGLIARFARQKGKEKNLKNTMSVLWNLWQNKCLARGLLFINLCVLLMYCHSITVNFYFLIVRFFALPVFGSGSMKYHFGYS